MFGHGYVPRAVISSADMAGCFITVFVLFGQHTRPVSFVPGTNPEETQRAMLTAILSAFSDKLHVYTAKKFPDPANTRR